MPNGASTYFVSQNWESNDHPDNDEGTKLKWLKKVKPHLRIHSEREIWMDARLVDGSEYLLLLLVVCLLLVA